MSTADQQREDVAPMAARRRRSLRERLRGPDSYGLLLLSILLSLLLTAVLDEHRWGRVIIAMTSGATALLAFWTSRPSPRVLRWVVVGVIFGVVGASVTALFDTDNALNGASRTILALLTAASPVAIAARLLRHPRVQGSTILGALSIYLLLGLFFAFLFSAIGVIGEPFFAGQPRASAVDYLYFSFSTLTTVGFGDLTAARDLGRMLAVSEALIGQLYLVTVVALLVGNIGRGRIRPPDRS